MLLTKALSVIAKIWKQPVCPPRADWLNSSTPLEWNTIKKDEEVLFLTC